MSNRNKYEYLKQLDGTYKCPRCGKTFNKYGIGPHIWRAHSDDGKDFKPYLDKIPWNKNLTKETDIRIKQIADKIGNNHWLGRMHKDESKIKISNGRKKWFED